VAQNGVCVTPLPVCVAPQILQNNVCVTPIPAPTLAVSISAPKSTVGTPVTVSWSSTDAMSCSGLDGLTGKKATSGSETVSSTVGGQFKYTLSCDGVSGNATKSVNLIVPMPVYPTDYENKNNINLDNPTIPDSSDIKNIVIEPGELGFNPRAMAFADFTQNGAYSAVVLSGMYRAVFPLEVNPGKGADSGAKVYFVEKDSSGLWKDITGTLIKDLSTRYTCISPSFIRVADINNDGKPDVFIGCTGTDFNAANGMDLSPYWASKQYELLSQTDGSYKVVELPNLKLYAHQVALADIDGDGNIDVITVDTSTNFTPLILWGHGDGAFTADITRFPADMHFKAIYSIAAVPVNGKLNVIVGGYTPGSYRGTATPTYDPALDMSWYGTKVLNYTNGKFEYVQDFTDGIPVINKTNYKYSMAYDWIYRSGYYYNLRSTTDAKSPDWFAIVKTNAATGASEILEEHYRPDGFGDGPGNLMLTSKNEIVYMMAGCGDNSKRTFDWWYFACKYSVPLK
jgi:hypothetical protein